MMLNLTVFVLGLAVSPMTDAAPPAPPRQVIGLTMGWRFQRGPVEGAQRTDFADDTWTRVTLPHTWNARDGQDGGNNYYRGPSWYRRTFEIPAHHADSRVFLRIGAANTVADVYCNGTHVGQHRGGYAAFVYELTSVVRRDRLNTLAVRVDNTHVDDVPPYSADFTFFGGLYRQVDLLYTPKVCISPLDHGSAGLYVSTVDPNAHRATIEVRGIVSNGTDVRMLLGYFVRLFDAEGRIVARATDMVSTEPRTDDNRFRTSLTLERPRLWQGRHDPYLYRVEVELNVLGRLIDRVELPFGVRSYRVDPRRGFILNGTPYDLYGVNRHQDLRDHGWALDLRDHEADLRMIYDLGCTMVRLAHYQHDPYVYDWCDRNGLVVWAEIPLINRITHHPGLTANCTQQLTELIRQNFNHPSICFWGIHNEITAPWLKERGPDPAALVGQLHAHAKREDPGRLTVCAATDPVDHPANWHTDLTAFNRYMGWYGGQAADIGPWLDNLLKQRGVGVGISEYGAGASLKHHAWPPTMPQHDGPHHPEEYQAAFHEAYWTAMRTRPFVWCKLIWNMFDFASDGRNEGDAPGINDKGLVTYDRRTTKDALHWYRAQWHAKPMVHLTARRYDPRPMTMPIRVYSNCDRVELTVNGAPRAGRRSGRVFEFDLGPVSGDTARVEAVGYRGDERVTDVCTWRLERATPANSD